MNFSDTFERAVQVMGRVVEDRLQQQISEMDARWSSFMSRGRTATAQAAGAESINSS